MDGKSAAIHTREAATYFLADCLEQARRPVAGWDRRVRAYVPLITQDQINEYLMQFPTNCQEISA